MPGFVADEDLGQARGSQRCQCQSAALGGNRIASGPPVQHRQLKCFFKMISPDNMVHKPTSLSLPWAIDPTKALPLDIGQRCQSRKEAKCWCQTAEELCLRGQLPRLLHQSASQSHHLSLLLTSTELLPASHCGSVCTCQWEPSSDPSCLTVVSKSNVVDNKCQIGERVRLLHFWIAKSLQSPKWLGVSWHVG